MSTLLADFRACAEALIDQPVLSAAADRDLHARVRRNITPLNTWFSEKAGWRVQDHPEFVRLVATPEVPEAAHAPPWARDRRDLELLVWVLWYGEHTNGRKFTLSQLADEIRDRTGRLGDDQPPFDWQRATDRRRLARAFGALEEMGAIRVRDGSLAEWQDEEGKRDALCEWGSLAWQLHIAIPTPLLDRMAEGERVDDLHGPTSAEPRVRAYRQMLLGPALFRREDREAFLYVTSDPVRTAAIIEDIETHTGWEVEVSSAYVRVLRSSSRLDSVRPPIPADGSLSHLVYLACAELRKLRREGALLDAGDGFLEVRETRMELLVSDLRAEYGRKWKKDLRTASTTRLAELLIPELKRWGLVRGPREDGSLLITPLASRLAGEYIDDTQVPADDEE